MQKIHIGWIYLIMIILGWALSEVFFELMEKYDQKKMDTLLNRVFYGLHFMGFNMALMGLMELYILIQNELKKYM